MEKIDHYQILRRMDSAGSGATYLARDYRNKTNAVIMMVQLDRIATPGETAQFRTSLTQDLEKVKRLTHPRIVPVRETFEQMGFTWIVTEFIEGKALGALAKEGFSKKDLAAALRQTAECLDYAHEQGVFHLHLKPDSILVREDGAVRILGFGLMRISGVSPGAVSGESLGPANYTSPEQIQGLAVDGRSDQYSLAAIAYEALTGEPPFSGSFSSIREKIINEDPIPPERLEPSLSVEAGKVLLKALSKNPDGRYANCSELTRALEKALTAGPEQAPVAAKNGSPKTKVGSPKTRVGSAKAKEASPKAKDGSPKTKDADIPEVRGEAALEKGPEATREVSIEPFDWPADVMWEQRPERKKFAVSGVAIWLVAGILVGTYVGYRMIAGSSSAHTEPVPVPTVPAAAVAAATELPQASVGLLYSQSLLTPGEPSAESWSAQEPLPPGLTLEGYTKTLHGVPTQVGEFTFDVLPTGPAVAPEPQSFTLKVVSALEIVTLPQLPRAAVGAEYSHQLVASGVSWPLQWAIVEGGFPPGVRLDFTGGAISGTPTQAGEFKFLLEAADSSNAKVRQEFSLKVDQRGRLSFSSALPTAVLSKPYSHRLNGFGGNPPYRWSIGSGSLPPGLSMTAAGMIQGTPRQAGVFPIALRLEDATREVVSNEATISVGGTLAITGPAELPAGGLGRAYSSLLRASEGSPPYQWSVDEGSMPDGLSLSAASGLISGTPRSVGRSTLVIQARDRLGAEAEQRFTLEVTGGIVIATATLPPVEALADYSYQMEASQGTPPYAWSISAGSLPPGLSLDGGSGRISGTPTAAGEVRFGLQVRDAAGATASRALSVRVAPALQITSGASLPEARLGAPYSHQLRASGGTAPHSWSAADSSLAPGLSLNASSGLISGTPTRAGRFQLQIEVRSNAGATVSQLYGLNVGVLSGRLQWRGNLESNRVLTIQDGKFPSTGNLTGELPGVPVRVEVEPSGVAMVQAPSSDNGWKLLVLHSGNEPRNEITVRWTQTE